MQLYLDNPANYVSLFQIQFRDLVLVAGLGPSPVLSDTQHRYNAHQPPFMCYLALSRGNITIHATFIFSYYDCFCSLHHFIAMYKLIGKYLNLVVLALQSTHYIVSITSSAAFCYEVLLLAHGITESVEREEREQSSAPLYKYFLLDP